MIQEYCRLKVSPLLRIVLPVSCVKEVVQLQLQDISPIPMVDPCLLGITNQRGNLLWVLHLERFLGIPPNPLPKPVMAIAIHAQMADAGIRRIACVVMALEGIINLDSQRFLPLPNKLPSRAKALLSGLVKVERDTYGVLNVKEIFRILNPEMGGEKAIAELELNTFC